ncbi:MAG: DUF1622 domain-containing protein, partial [Burkholderiales bacterium]
GRAMQDWLAVVSDYAILLIDAIALVVIVFGTLQAATAVVRGMFSPPDAQQRRAIWLNYARWLIAGLTFQLAADIIETSISTDWEAIARVGAIAVIRTFLNYFLERDLSEVREARAGAKAERAGDAG